MSGRERIVAALLLAAAAALVSVRGAYEPDLWWHLAQGREDAAGRLVRTNVFGAAHADYRQHYTSWLFDLASYELYTRGGAGAIQAAQALTLFVTFFALYGACRLEAPPSASAALLILTWLVLEPRALPRPHLASFAGMAGLSLILAVARRRHSWRPLVWAIPLIALWSNVHVESAFGAAFLGIAAAGEWLRPSFLTRAQALRALALAAAAVAALLANPYGWGLLHYLHENASVPSIIAIAELRPPYLPTYRAYYALAALAALLLSLPPSRVVLWELAAGAVFGALGFRYLRLTPLLALALAPALARRLSAWIPRPLDGRAVVLTALAAGLALSRLPPAAYLSEWRAGGNAYAPPAFISPGAARFAETAGLAGPVFNSFNAGGYVAWRLYPAARTFQDSRLQAWPPSVFASMLAVSDQAEWDRLVAGVDWAFVQRRNPNQLSGVGRFPADDWALVYWDDAAEIRVRRAGRFQDVAARYEIRRLTPEADPFALAEGVSTTTDARVVDEARQLARFDPDRLAPVAVLCGAGQDDACAALNRLAADAPAVRERAAPLLQRARDGSGRGQ
jgi:hypothetical protein